MPDLDLQGRTALITGGTSGIGREIARQLSQRGAKVVIVGRTHAKGETVVAESPTLEFIQADLAEMKQVRQLADQFLQSYDRLDILVHSAGVHHYGRTLTTEGVEYNFAANYLSRFLLTELLLPAMERSAPSRIVAVGSPYVFDPKRFLTFEGLKGERPLRPVIALLKAGMANSVWTVHLAQKLRGRAVEICNMILGIVRTDILRNDPLLIRMIDNVLQPLRGMSAEQAGKHYVELATTPRLMVYPKGLFFKNTRRGVLAANVPQGTFDSALGERLWAFSERLV